MKKDCKIVMMTMFKNEAHVIKRMLNSCLPHVDYYVFQDNGSTDDTPEIVKQFLTENGLSGEMYFCEEGWKGFGWNRDHLIQYCQKAEHGCDWILKMDCDEVLEIDDDFDWTPLNEKQHQSFHIPAVAGSSIYYRAWMYNVKLPWRFNHDPCHETVYCEIPEIGLDFQRYDLPTSFRQIGFNEGQSWSNPLKFVLDALVLEEKMMREGTILNNLYHFWYIGKSYLDAYQCNTFPLGESQKKEYAKRAIYYLQEYVNRNRKENNGITQEDETCYMSMIFTAECYEFLEEHSSCIATYNLAGQFATGRNDHLFALANLYKKLEEYDEMLKVTTEMMRTERTNAFPKYCNFVNTAMYHDSPEGRVQELHNFALSKRKKEEVLPFYINKITDRNLFVVDNFYSNPDDVRNFALSVEFKEDLRWYKGFRSTRIYQPPGIKQTFERVIGQSIEQFETTGSYNGVFQITRASDPQVYHYDSQRWAAMIYLTPNAPLESGTRLHRSKITNLRHKSEPDVDNSFSYGFYDSTKFDIVDSAGNIYNRLVIMDAQNIHSAGPYFGNTKEDGRLTHLFFFD